MYAVKTEHWQGQPAFPQRPEDPVNFRTQQYKNGRYPYVIRPVAPIPGYTVLYDA